VGQSPLRGRPAAELEISVSQGSRLTAVHAKGANPAENYNRTYGNRTGLQVPGIFSYDIAGVVNGPQSRGALVAPGQPDDFHDSLPQRHRRVCRASSGGREAGRPAPPRHHHGRGGCIPLAADTACHVLVGRHAAGKSHFKSQHGQLSGDTQLR
jgi:hypothetical protein